MPDPARAVRIGIPDKTGNTFSWVPWPTDQRLPDAAFGPAGLLITGQAKLRPCLVLNLRDEIDAYGEAHVLPLSGFEPSTSAAAALVRANQVPFAHFLAGDKTRGFEDATADFRWTWRVRVGDLAMGRHEAELDPETLVRLLVRYRDYLYPAE